MSRFVFTASLLLSASVAFGGGTVPCSCLGDVNDDHNVDAADLAVLLGDWGPGFSFADLDSNDVVDAADLAILLGNWGSCSAPSNDHCEDAELIGLGSHPFCTAGADTDDLPDVNGTGDCSGAIYHDVWYRFEPAGSGTLHLTTCNAQTFDTQVAVYGSVIPGLCSCPSNGIGLATIIGCSDDTFGPLQLCSTLDVDVVAGNCYYIRLGGWAFQQGTGVLDLTFTSVGPDCSDPIETPDSLNITVTGNTADNASNQVDTSCVDGDTTAEWIRFDGPCGSFTNTTTITTCYPETDYDTTIRVFEITGPGCPGTTEIACNDDSPAPGCQIRGLNRKSKVSFTSIQNATYLIRVGGYQGATGNYKLTINTSCP